MTLNNYGYSAVYNELVLPTRSAHAQFCIQNIIFLDYGNNEKLLVFPRVPESMRFLFISREILLRFAKTLGCFSMSI